MGLSESARAESEMGREPNNLASSLLCEMRASIEDVRVDVKDVRERVGDLGSFAVHANSRNDKLEKELAAPKKRVEKLEKAR